MNADRPRWNLDPDDAAKARRMAERLKPSAQRKQRELYQARLLAKAEANRRAARLHAAPGTTPPNPPGGVS